MRTVLQILGGAFHDIWDDLWTVLACNLFWLLTNLLIIPGPPATVAMVYYGNRLAHGEEVDLEDFWRVFRRSWGLGWRWGIVNLGVIAFLAFDIYLTGLFQGASWTPYLQGLYVALLLGWLAWQFFALPFLFEQEQPVVRQAWRNGSMLIGRNLGFALLLFVFVLLILIAGTFAFLLSAMFGAVFVSSAANRAVVNRLEEVNLQGSISRQNSAEGEA